MVYFLHRFFLRGTTISLSIYNLEIRLRFLNETKEFNRTNFDDEK